MSSQRKSLLWLAYLILSSRFQTARKGGQGPTPSVVFGTSQGVHVRDYDSVHSLCKYAAKRAGVPGRPLFAMDDPIATSKQSFKKVNIHDSYSMALTAITYKRVSINIRQ